jgi:broad specificity polyphosphatase/5'/3'-nucleotidase SurE
MEFSNEKTLEFIEDYKQYEILWNSRDKEYKNNRKKRDVSALLAEKCFASVTDLKTKIKTHRSSFHLEHRKLCKNKVDREKIFPRNGSPTNHSDLF